MARDRLWLVTLTLVATGTLAAHAQEGRLADRPRPRPGAGSVLDVAIGERAAARRIQLEARSRLLTALNDARDDVLGPADETLLEQAIARYDLVLGSFPRDVEVWLERGLALARLRRTLGTGQVERRIDEAITCFETARAIDPEREEGWVSFELAVLHTERHEYRRAGDEYARALRADVPYPAALQYRLSAAEEVAVYLFVAPGPPTILGNWAEVMMLGGDTDEAIALYRRAHAAAPAESASSALAAWGLALAEERAGSHGDAVADATRAIDTDPIDHGSPAGAAIAAQHGVFAVLHLDGVFFEPAYEIHAYEALGHEALAARATSAEARSSELSAALRSTRYFLAEGGRDSIYASTATRAEERLSAALAASERARP